MLEKCDVIFQGGRIIDGSGKPGCIGDVAITGDSIVAIGDCDACSTLRFPHPSRAKRYMVPTRLSIGRHLRNPRSQRQALGTLWLTALLRLKMVRRHLRYQATS